MGQLPYGAGRNAESWEQKPLLAPVREFWINPATDPKILPENGQEQCEHLPQPIFPVRLSLYTNTTTYISRMSSQTAIFSKSTAEGLAGIRHSTFLHSLREAYYPSFANGHRDTQLGNPCCLTSKAEPLSLHCLSPV